LANQYVAKNQFLIRNRESLIFLVQGAADIITNLSVWS
jgi:hypothetical protein